MLKKIELVLLDTNLGKSYSGTDIAKLIFSQNPELPIIVVGKKVDYSTPIIGYFSKSEIFLNEKSRKIFIKNVEKILKKEERKNATIKNQQNSL